MSPNEGMRTMKRKSPSSRQKPLRLASITRSARAASDRIASSATGQTPTAREWSSGGMARTAAGAARDDRPPRGSPDLRAREGIGDRLLALVQLLEHVAQRLPQ